jgi:hypothetical protein
MRYPKVLVALVRFEDHAEPLSGDCQRDMVMGAAVAPDSRWPKLVGRLAWESVGFPGWNRPDPAFTRLLGATEQPGMVSTSRGFVEKLTCPRDPEP